MPQITLRIHNQPSLIVAVADDHIFGEFAVHSSLGGEGLFIVTHIPSGMMVPAGFGWNGEVLELGDEDEALKFAQRLAQDMTPEDIVQTNGEWHATKSGRTKRRRIESDLWPD